ncbi:TAXI family TRAP transporter solute-binding subunit [Methylobacterium platani]|uniref:C4-dicarboxylate ABC transporter substrate-binding protein n=2 Tax=Methylobacterium platani TaxID=427683 RepID=A0A179S0W4_9HYPH|nr:TAXI family TRAP transporter solute-binding subunit [Methylobacterium platani]KMO16691.1 C4-dicarboxylate ABC transporter substrate-binding protein [Methylobacterium platani JCM 14648]OAS18298.1 C4-dicarboxylate ABC transporter substrate-binding protein [Methylobacterium platani]
MRPWLIAAACCLALLAPPPAARAGEPLHLVLATATPGGGFPAYGAALAAALREVDPDLVLDLRASKGSTENLVLLREGAVDLGLVQGEYAYEALAGQGNGQGRGASLSITVVAPVYAAPGLFVVPADGPVRSLDDLRGRPVALGTRSSGLTAMGRTVLRGARIDPERDIAPILLDHAGDGPAMLRNGRAAALFGGGTGWPGFRAAAEAPGGARFLGPPASAIAAILAASPSLRRMTVPAGTFPGQAEAVETVGSWSFVLGKPGLDPAAVTRLVAAIDRAKPALARLLPHERPSDPRDLAAAVPAEWLHPATAAFLRD